MTPAEEAMKEIDIALTTARIEVYEGYVRDVDNKIADWFFKNEKLIRKSLSLMKFIEGVEVNMEAKTPSDWVENNYIAIKSFIEAKRIVGE